MNISILAAKRIINCLFMMGSNGSGVMMALMPNTIKMLRMLEPKTLPMAIPEFFFKAATIEVISSGREVAVAITVRPMVLSLIPQFLAKI